MPVQELCSIWCGGESLHRLECSAGLAIVKTFCRVLLHLFAISACESLGIDGPKPLRMIGWAMRQRTWALTRNLIPAVVFFAAGMLSSPLFGAEQILTCTNLVSRVTWQIRVDFKASTVDANPARISGAEISWHDSTDGGNYTLDRKTGKLTVVFASSTGGYFINDRCSPPI